MGYISSHVSIYEEQPHCDTFLVFAVVEVIMLDFFNYLKGQGGIMGSVLLFALSLIFMMMQDIMQPL